MSTQKFENILLSRGDVEELLNLYNSLDDALGDVGECFDLSLSQLRDLQSQMWKLRGRFQFRPQANEEGNPAHWKPYVLVDDDRAWHYKGETE